MKYVELRENGKRGHCSAPQSRAGRCYGNRRIRGSGKPPMWRAGRQSGMLSPAMSFRIDSLAPEVNKHLLRQLTGVKIANSKKRQIICCGEAQPGTVVGAPA